MKNSIIVSLVMALGLFVLLCSGTLDSNGKLANAGAPGETTCSGPGCHGAGNGSWSTGGLPDNGGPGSITLTAVPALIGNTYVPGTTYSMSIKVSETGKNLFGFSCEIVDNSGNTNPTINNTMGVFTITDPIRTRKGQTFGTGRVTVTHQTNGGLSPNSATFNFNWTAPSSGTVNLYYDGAAVNQDSLPNAADNVYSKFVKLTPSTTAITDFSLLKQVDVFPNPANDNMTVKLSIEVPLTINAYLKGADGRIVKRFFAKQFDAGENSEQLDVKEVPEGIYFLILNGEGFNKAEHVVIMH
jgi:hypothetical protein